MAETASYYSYRESDIGLIGRRWQILINVREYGNLQFAGRPVRSVDLRYGLRSPHNYSMVSIAYVLG